MLSTPDLCRFPMIMIMLISIMAFAGPENIGRFIETSSNENHPKTIAAVSNLMPLLF